MHLSHSKILKIPIPPPLQPPLTQLYDSAVSNFRGFLRVLLDLFAADAREGGCDAHSHGKYWVAESDYCKEEVSHGLSSAGREGRGGYAVALKIEVALAIIAGSCEASSLQMPWTWVHTLR